MRKTNQSLISDMGKTIITVLLILFQLQVCGQSTQDTISAEPMQASTIVGTFVKGMESYTFHENGKCSYHHIGPRSLVCKGKWKIQNDTLICLFSSMNTILQGDNKKLKNEPLINRFIYYKNHLYSFQEQDDKTTIVFTPQLKRISH